MSRPKGFAHTAETRAKLSAAMRGNKNSKGSSFRVGYKPTAETRAKMSAARMGNQNARGHRHIRHGYHNSPTYYSWLAMKQRCHNPNYGGYRYYGGRGIAVCSRWESFENFLADMGERPDGLSIDRIDNDGDYEPDNCRWATPQEQRLNQRPRSFGVIVK